MINLEMGVWLFWSDLTGQHAADHWSFCRLICHHTLCRLSRSNFFSTHLLFLPIGCLFPDEQTALVVLPAWSLYNTPWMLRLPNALTLVSSSWYRRGAGIPHGRVVLPGFFIWGWQGCGQQAWAWVRLQGNMGNGYRFVVIMYWITGNPVWK